MFIGLTIDIVLVYTSGRIASGRGGSDSMVDVAARETIEDYLRKEERDASFEKNGDALNVYMGRAFKIGIQNTHSRYKDRFQKDDRVKEVKVIRMGEIELTLKTPQNGIKKVNIYISKD